MKKHSLLLLLGTLLLSGCNIVDEPELSVDIDGSSAVAESSSISTDTSKEQPKEKHVSDLQEDEYHLFPSYYLEKLGSYNSYKAVTVGAAESVATQEINVTTIKNGEYSYLYNSSESSMYSSMHEAYYHNDKALYKDKGDEDYTLTDLTTYLKTYGTYPFGNSIEGYKVTGEAITSVTKTSSDNDTYTFTLVFDVNKATNNVKIQMKKFGGLDNYPSFKSISISITVKDDYTPVKLELASSYSVKKIILVNCDQKHTVTYSNFNEEIEIPNLDSVKPLFE